MKQVPRQRDDVPRAAAREVLADRNPELLGVPLAKHVAAQKELEQLFDAGRAAGADILDPVDHLVNTDGICMSVADGRSLYVDRHHLSTYGAIRISPLFEQVVTAP